jgi:hypothetical protein
VRGMEINCDKSRLYTYGISNKYSNNITRLFDIPSKDLDSGLKYMGFFLKKNILDFRLEVIGG